MGVWCDFCDIWNGRMMIESYDFGKMVVNGVEYCSDLIVYPGTVDSGWVRKDEHGLCEADIEDILDFGPEVLVIGSGAHATLTVAPEMLRLLASMNIEPIVQKTGDAWRTFNDNVERKARVVGAFHLTC